MGSIDTGWVGATAENLSGLPDTAVMNTVREVAGFLQSWTRENRAKKNQGSLFDRSKFASSDNPYDQIRTARSAVRDDDVVGATADVTEGLILQGVGCESPNETVADLMNQVAAGLDLDGYLRTAYRELFSTSQTVTATWWGYREFTPRTRSSSEKKNKNGTTRSYPARTKYRLYVPTKVITLDQECVVPVGTSLFGEDRLAWNANDSMLSAWEGMEASPQTGSDPVMASLFLGHYTPTIEEKAWMSRVGIDPDRLMEFNPDRVWRHTRTKASYERFPDVRMKSVFRLLDMKQQLLESDRVMLVGAANYILLVKKGSNEQPAAQPEIDNLKENFSVIAKLPVIVSDHRLEIEIISPKLDMTLAKEKYDLIDGRILSRLLGSLSVNSGARGDQTAGITTRMVARSLENQRHMLRRMVEKDILDKIWDHPANQEVFTKLSAKPSDKASLAFMPRNVQLDNDAQLISAIMTARQSREISRESFLDFLGFDQSVEAQRMEREAEIYDDIFRTTVPFSSQGGDGKGGEPSAVAGARGGRPQGGGSSPQSAQGQAKKRTASGAPSTGGAGS